MYHIPKKRFGQNFLQDQTIINAIIQNLNLKKTDTVIEIGPGLGALTKPLLKKLNSLKAIEIDTELQTILKKEFALHNLELINCDVLKVDFNQFGNNLRIIGNLPYNISTPLLIKLLNYNQNILDMHFMLQKEVAERLCATPQGKTYGRLSVMVQAYYDVSYILDVPAHAFNPKPQVESAVVRLTPKVESMTKDINFTKLEFLVRTAFSMRRKTLANNLKSLLSADEILSMNINPKLRPEQISVNEYLQIEKFISK